MRRLKWICLSLVSFYFILAQPLMSEGQESAYFVTPLFSQGQVAANQVYFEMIAVPSSQAKIGLRVTNEGEEELRLKLAANNAYTNSHLVVEFNSAKWRQAGTRSIDFSEMVSLEKELILQPKSSKDVFGAIKYPEEELVGDILGALVVEPIDIKKENQITNVLRYEMVVLIHGQPPVEQSKIVFHHVRIGQVGLRNQVIATFENTQAEILRDVTVTTAITKKGQQKVLYEQEVGEGKLSPMAVVAFQTPLGEHFKPGNYTLALKVSSGEERWEFQEDFEIKSQEAREFNQVALDPKPQNNQLVIVLIGLGLVGGIVSYWLVFRRAQKS